ncbi:MAG: hypothetical protein K1X55_15220 [Chitinophagales bacterium]|nr:hypothetical protein [Chitinophagales bacterium]
MKELLPRYIMTLFIIITFYGWSLGQSTYLIQIEYPGSHYKKKYYYYMADSLPISKLQILNYTSWNYWGTIECCNGKTYLDSVAIYNGKIAYDSVIDKYSNIIDNLLENYESGISF